MENLPPPSGSTSALGVGQGKQDGTVDPKATNGEAVAKGLSGGDGARRSPSTLDEDCTRTGYDVVELARGESCGSRASSGTTSSSGCEAAAELIREFTERLGCALNPGKTLQTARKDQQLQPMTRQGQWIRGKAEPFPHVRCGTRNPVAASGRMAGEQPTLDPIHDSVAPRVERAPHHRAWGTGGAVGGGDGDSGKEQVSAQDMPVQVNSMLALRSLRFQWEWGFDDSKRYPLPRASFDEFWLRRSRRGAHSGISPKTPTLFPLEPGSLKQGSRLPSKQVLFPATLVLDLRPS